MPSTQKLKPPISADPDETYKAQDIRTKDETRDRADLIMLFRLLLQEPPAGHDFKACPTCRHYGIERI